jgi:exosome complex component CSL4
VSLIVNVTPGEQLAFEEEYIGGKGTFTEKGVIYSSIKGEKIEDSKSRMVSVKGKCFELIRPGDVVVGTVSTISKQMASVEYVTPENKFKSYPSIRTFLRISELSTDYAESMRSYITIGDIIKARVIEIKTLGIYLTIKQPELGVVRTFCTNCRSELTMRGRLLVCSECGAKQQRKMALPQNHANAPQ